MYRDYWFFLVAMGTEEAAVIWQIMMLEAGCWQISHQVRAEGMSASCWPDVYLRTQMVRGASPPWRPMSGQTVETDGCPPPLHICPSSTYRCYFDLRTEIRELSSLLGWCWTAVSDLKAVL